MTVVDWVDLEVATKEIVAVLADGITEGATVSIGVPEHWTKSEPTHVQVEQDSPETFDRSQLSRSSALIRCTVWAASTSEAKRFARRLHGELRAYAGAPPVLRVRSRLGVMPARDPATNAELATFTVEVSARSIPLT